MLRTLRAFAWLRFRMLVNSLERTGSRDALERFSLAIEKLGPIMAGVLLIPSALALSVMGAAAGFALAHGEVGSLLFTAGRFILLGVLVLSLVGPLMLPSADRTNPVRMLLLPISRGTMYVAQSSSALGDPWIMLSVPLLLFVPIGLVAGGAIAASLLALAAGALFLLAAVGLTSLATSVLHLVLRDRRRGELIALLFIIVLPALGMLPGLLEGRRHDRRESRQPAASSEAAPAWLTTAGERAAAALPSELYIAATRAGSTRETTGSLVAIAALGASVMVLHGLGFLVFGRILDSPGATGARRTAGADRWSGKIFGLSSSTSAVALAHLRLGLRTPRGRSTMLSPIIVLGLMAALMARSSSLSFGGMRFDNGLGLACFASFMAVVAILPIGMNQFAVDRAGFTLALLSPIRERDYLDGKAIGNALIIAPGLILSVVVPMIAAPGGSPALWASLVLSIVSIYLMVSPAAAIVSAVFPRAVDLNSIGRGSNANGLAGFIGLAAFAAAALPCALLVLLAVRVLQAPSLAPLMLVPWVAIAFAVNRALFGIARSVFIGRRENLALIAGQRT